MTAPLPHPIPAPVRDPSAWRPEELGEPSNLGVQLSERQLTHLVETAQRCVERGVVGESVTRNDFPLGELETDIAQWRSGVFSGLGFTLLRGIPVENLPLETVETLYFGLGTHFGEAVSQSNLGDRLGHVTDVGGKDRRERAYRNSRELTMHTDRCDVIGMLCVRKAQTGGLSGYTSAHAIYNAMHEERPDLLGPLLRGFRYHRFGEQPEGEPQVTKHEVPIFEPAHGRLSLVFLRTYIEMAAAELDRPLTEIEVEALDYFEATARREDLRLSFMLEPGECIFFNNCTMLHHRTGFDDGPDPTAKRLLLRLWLMAPDDWPLGPAHRAYKGHGIAERSDHSTYYDGTALKEPVREAG